MAIDRHVAFGSWKSAAHSHNAELVNGIVKRQISPIQQPHAMPRPRQPGGAILEEKVQPQVRFPRDEGNADEPEICRDESGG
jgi:hypothetical protein